MYKILPIFIILLVFTPQAQSIDAQTKQKLAIDPYWIKLLKYRKSGNNKWLSEIKSDAFFLSSKGKYDPLLELEANIVSLFSESNINNDHPRCKFVERFRWLNSKLNQLDESRALIGCKAFQDWANLSQLQSASLLYASGYLGNPTSYFGHILLKFNYQQAQKLTLLDKSINFGAKIDEQDGPIKYVVKGFTGGYSANFKDDAFYRHLNIYSHQESRAIWSYQLNLNRQQLLSLAAHSWELQGVDFDYYFLDENCASRMMELINVVAPSFYAEPKAMWVHPISLVKQQAKLFKNIEFHPSSYQSFLAQYQDLSSQEQSVTNTLFSSRKISNNSFANLKESRQIAVLNTLLVYFHYLNVQQDDNLYVFKQQVLAKRFSLSPSQQKPKSTKQISPDNGNYPSLFRIGTTQNTSSSSPTLSFQFRPSYYDLLAEDTGRLPYSNLEFSNIELSISDNRWSLKRFDILNIISLTPPQTALEHSSQSKFAWSLQAGFINENNQCTDCLSANITGGIGRSYQMSDQLIYGLMNAGYMGQQQEFDGRLQMGALIKLFPNWSHHIQYQHDLGITNRHQENYQFLIENRLTLSDRYDLRVNMKVNEVSSSVALYLSYYWQ